MCICVGFVLFRGGWGVFEKKPMATLLGFSFEIDFLTRTILGSLGEEPSSVISTLPPLFRDPCMVFCFSLGDETCF